MYIAAFDPGLTGAYAIMSPAGVIECEDLPVMRDKSLGWIDGAELLTRLIRLKAGFSMRAIVERQGARPVQSVASAFKMGVAFGSILATLQNAACSIEFVTPAVWKRDMGLSQDKNASLDKARLLYPMVELDRKKDHNKAEALLIARWGLFAQTGNMP